MEAPYDAHSVSRLLALLPNIRLVIFFISKYFPNIWEQGDSLQKLSNLRYPAFWVSSQSYSPIFDQYFSKKILTYKSKMFLWVGSWPYFKWHYVFIPYITFPCVTIPHVIILKLRNNPEISLPNLVPFPLTQLSPFSPHLAQPSPLTQLSPFSLRVGQVRVKVLASYPDLT